MKGFRLVLVAAALCLAVFAPLAAPAYAWGNYPSGCANPCASPYPNQYANGYPYAYQYPYPYQYQYANRYPYPYQYQYQYPKQYRYVAPAPPPPPPPLYFYPPVYVVPGVSTGYGNYTRCQQFGLHQANCFVPNAANSPNLGSIQMEPGIQIWGNCTAGQTMSQNGTNYQCSKTGAGWFPA